ncbi:MAG: hypothetical protein AB7V14_05000 [Kiritimatiellia bacterium]
MNQNNRELWNQLRTAYRPQAPELDVSAIMDAVRREAAAAPLRRPAAGLAAPIPTWVCAAAASLAFLAAAGVVARSVAMADRQISQAWLQSVQPSEFAQNFLTFDDSSL